MKQIRLNVINADHYTITTTTDSGLHVLRYAIFVLVCLESAVNDAFLRHKAFCIIQWHPSSLFIVFDHRHLGHKQQVNKIKQHVIINDSYGHELWLCAILLYGKKHHEKIMNSLLQLQVLAC